MRRSDEEDGEVMIRGISRAVAIIVEELRVWRAGG